MKYSDEQIVELIIQNKLKIYKTAKAILKNEDDVADAIQEVLISAYQNFDKLKEKKYFTTWVIRITINKCYDILNKNTVYSKKIVKLQEYTKTNSTEDEFEKSIIESALNSIDEELRLITVMYYYNDMKVKEIAEVLKIKEGTVKSRLSRAREKLYVILSEEEVKNNE